MTVTYVMNPVTDGRTHAVAYPTREAAIAAATSNDYVISGAADVIFTGALLVEFYNALTGKAVNKFESRAVGVERLLTALSQAASPAVVTQEETQVSKTQAATRSRKADAPFGDDAKITVIAAENPKRAGSKSHERFAMLKTGMTVGEVRKTVHYSTHDLIWDRDHNFIAIE
jgi:hypothetical protein